MILAVTRLAPQAGILAQPIARDTFEIFRVNHLTARLVFKLIVFTQKVGAETALENTTPMLPDPSFALEAVCLLQGACT